ncbi:diguanylate cyclase [Niveibacterium sp. 24ML]|uniref:diguanylate cyclase domain-containing protein n=1 Tax=Niveibacterium sp. 24ML TaxID=2985512 RepID=UPI00226F9A8A|nr:diguanylate cyclase [Niveibacterium sp. 24ML]MCX9154933.1 diguanylate cyclase [Niveibacterium sp. 24ML]
MTQPTPSLFSLRQVLIVPYVALILALAVVIGVISYLTGSRAVATVSDHLLIETVGRIGQAVDRHVVGSGAVLEAVFPAGMSAPASIETDLQALRTRMWIATSLHIDPNNYAYYGNRAGQFIGLWRNSVSEGELRLKTRAEDPRTFYTFRGIGGALEEASRETKIFDPRARPWFKAGEGTQTHTWTAVYIDFRHGGLVATRARRVLNAAGEFEGVVATDVSLRGLNDFVSRLALSKNGIAFIVEPDGKLIASSASPNLKPQPDGTNARLGASESGHPLLAATYAQVRDTLASVKAAQLPQTRTFQGPKGETVHAAFDRVKDDAGLEWITVVAVPASDFMQGVTENVVRTAIVGGIAALLAIALGLRILGWVTGDLRRLSQSARAIGDGDLDSPVGVHRKDEIGQLARSFEAMQERLRTDRLTGLANRDAFMRRLGGRIGQHRRAADDSPFAVLFVDLNYFKQVNDRLGHEAGDKVLIEIAERLRDAVRASDFVARYAGDEFVLLLDRVADRAQAERVREHIEHVLAQPLRSVDVSALGSTALGGAVGLALFPQDGDEAEPLMRSADHEMYARKFSARGETSPIHADDGNA